jgi:hypothetical protein
MYTLKALTPEIVNGGGWAAGEAFSRAGGASDIDALEETWEPQSMGIPTNMTRIVFSGTLGGGSEIFNTAFYQSGYTSGSFPTDATLSAAVATTPWTDLSTAATAFMPASSTFLAVDAYFIVGGIAVKHAHAAYVHAGVGTTTHPVQCCVVTSLRTAVSTRAARGRMYWPATGGGLTSNGLLATSNTDALVDKLAALFTVLAAASTPAVVVSQTNTTFNQITSVDADYIPDTQRRRRNKLVSTRHSHTV